MTMERRALLEPIEIRAAGEDGKRVVAGYGAVFNVETDIGGMFREKIAPGAFAKAIAGDVRSLFDHNSALILGRTKSGTLRLKEDERGLHYEVDLPDTQAGRDLRVSMDRGDIDGSSFMFRVTRQSWDETGALPLRTIQEVELYEVGPVTFPQYPEAEVGLRSLDSARSEMVKTHNATGYLLRKARMEQKIRGL